MSSILSGLKRLIGSKRFIYVVVLLLVIQAAWIALSAVYPEAFDENYHFGLIKIYSHYLLPFISSQPPHANDFGAVARDPSYLYHYLMSWPYRLIKLFIGSQTGQIILLRFINIGLFSLGLVAYWRLLVKSKVSIQLANIVMLLFVLITIMPQLAGQINYDNLLFPLSGLILLLTLDAVTDLRHKRLPVVKLIIILSLCLLTSLVKYEFLPIFLAIIVFLTWTVARISGLSRSSFSRFWSEVKNGPLLQQVAVSLFLIVSLGLFIQRYGLDLVRYHSIQPDCSAVLSLKACSSYPPWYYDYMRHQDVLHHTNPATTNPIFYFFQWLYWMWYRLFFVVNGPNSGFVNFPPPPLPALAAGLLGLAGFYLILRYRQALFKRPPNQLMAVVCLFYLASLVLKGFATYKNTAILENMNGRYLLPILILLAALGAQAINLALVNRLKLRKYLLILILVMFIEGGGLLAFWARIDNSWLWPNQTVRTVNKVAHDITTDYVLVGPSTYNTSIWIFN